MVKFVRVLTQKNMLEVKLEDGKQKYGNCSPEIKAYAVANFKPGDDIEITYVPNGNLIDITAAGKPGTLKTATPASQTPAPAAGTSAQAAPAPAVQSPAAGTVQQPPKQEPPKQEPPRQNYRQDLAPEVSRSIRRQSVMASTCQLCQAIVCQNDTQPGFVADYVIAVFNKLIAEVEK